jgi:hypothetical protein
MPPAEGVDKAASPRKSLASCLFDSLQASVPFSEFPEDWVRSSPESETHTQTVFHLTEQFVVDV